MTTTSLFTNLTNIRKKYVLVNMPAYKFMELW